MTLDMPRTADWETVAVRRPAASAPGRDW